MSNKAGQARKLVKVAAASGVMRQLFTALHSKPGISC
jgi:hypothetical protein